MGNRTLLVKTTFYIIIVTMLLAILLPFFFFISSSFYSSYEVYEFPRSFLPKFSFDVKVTWEEDMYNLLFLEVYYMLHFLFLSLIVLNQYL